MLFMMSYWGIDISVMRGNRHGRRKELSGRWREWNGEVGVPLAWIKIIGASVSRALWEGNEGKIG